MIQRELGWEPRSAREKGFKRTLEFYREHGVALLDR